MTPDRLPHSLPYPSSSSRCEILSPNSQVFTNLHTLSQPSVWCCTLGSLGKAKAALTGQDSGSHSPFRCIAAVVLALINHTQTDEASTWQEVMVC